MHMSRKTKVKPPAISAEGSDTGPSIRHNPAHPDPVVAAQWDDPADTNERSRKPWQVRGARRRDGLRDMWARGTISQADWVAAEVFRDDYAVADGARLMTEHVGGRGETRGVEPGERQLDAMGRVRGAFQAVGIALSPIVVNVVLGGWTLEMLMEDAGVRHADAHDMVRLTLARLADFYAGEGLRGR